MLMVIFGAGASYDSNPSLPPGDFGPEVHPFRPPLADELFDNRPGFRSVLAQFKSCHPIVPYLEKRPGETSVEQVLEELKQEIPEHPVRTHQLAAIRFYLQGIISDCVSGWYGHSQGITTYNTLLDQLDRWRKNDETIFMVTFNRVQRSSL